MERKIKSITEAFSMQPVVLQVKDKPDEWNIDNSIKRIEFEISDEYASGETSVYRGYNFADKLIFQYLANSVNVHYF